MDIHPEVSKYMSELGKKGSAITNAKLTKKEKSERGRKGGRAGKGSKKPRAF